MKTNPSQHTPGLGHEAFVSAAFVCLRLAQQDDSDGKRQDRLDQSRAAERAALNALAAAPELTEALRALAALHADSVFICGEDDQPKVDRALRNASRALAKLNP